MKKLFCILLALCMSCAALSCSESKKDPKNDTVAEETITEKPFIDCTDTRFKEITVNLSITDGEPPISLTDLNIDSIDFGECIPSCTANCIHDTAQPPESYRGIAEYCCTDGNMLYFVVNYDMGCHEFAIFSYSPESAETSELYHLSDADNEQYITDIMATDGDVYVIYADTACRTFAKIERGSEQFRDIYSGSKNMQFYESESNRVILQEYTDSGTNEWVESFIEYDTDSGQVNILRENCRTESSGYPVARPTGTPDFSVTAITAWREKPEGSRKYDIVSDYWRIPSGVTNPQIIYASPEKLIFIVSIGTDYIGNNKTELHSLDLEKGEHYTLDITSLGDSFCYVNGFVIAMKAYDYYSNEEKSIYCISPETGMTFPIAMGSNCFIWNMNNSNGTMLLSWSTPSNNYDSNSERHLCIFK